MVRIRIINRINGQTQEHKVLKDFGAAADWFNRHKLKNDIKYYTKVQEIPGNMIQYNAQRLWSYRYIALPIIIALSLGLYMIKHGHN